MGEYRILQQFKTRLVSLQGRMGYFVKWKGYPNSENSWVDEQDAGNADDLIAQYWKTHSKTKKAPRKSVDAKTPKSGRKSTVPEDGSDRETSLPKKRGRKSHVKADSDAENGNDVEETRATKKSRKNTKESETPATEVSDIGDMKQYMSVTSWEKLIASVDTIEREEDGSLTVYFALKTGERVKEKSTICRQRFPQRLLDFFESNLRWRVADESEAGDT
ncbi:hypothetical protein BDZ94DRAFT_1169461 [Collybia nuda]|uniref:Chromo domain-containing protein n=1 Tax=Collybia nuda TaxID=64659 RepID=A0A9P6CH40_9AGAR|nr:hypothetical protein BDZ94DRAFT_1169461 [Collybia nuda]